MISPSSEIIMRSSFSSRNPIKVCGVNCLRFMFGNKSAPPAVYIAFDPCLAFKDTASATLCGEKYSKGGKRNIDQSGICGWHFFDNVMFYFWKYPHVYKKTICSVVCPNFFKLDIDIILTTVVLHESVQEI